VTHYLCCLVIIVLVVVIVIVIALVVFIDKRCFVRQRGAVVDFNDHVHAAIQMLAGAGYKLMVITNISAVKESLTARIRLNIPVREAVCYAMDGEKPVKIVGDEMIIENITDGGIVVIRD